LSAFEYLDENSMRVVLQQLPNRRNPLREEYQHYVLIELSSVRTEDDLGASCEAVLAKGFETGGVVDAVIAASRAQSAELWQLRESVSEAQTRLGMPIKHDVSVPVSRVPEFLTQAADAVSAQLPGVRLVAFGHLGDGNIHFNLSHPSGMDEDDFQARAASLNRTVHDIAVALEGSFSAEHGIGRLKRDELVHYRSPVELRLMRALKQTLDPRNILNPGVVL
jgi:FAD/FMN-containing dehydrogenase